MTPATTADKLDTVLETYAHAIGRVFHTEHGPVRLDCFTIDRGEVVAAVAVLDYREFPLKMNLEEFLAAYY